MLYLFDERSQHSKPTHFWKVQNENCWFMRLLESLDRIISSFEIETQCRQSVIIMYQKLRRWESKSSLLNAKMEVTVFENLINQQFSFCSFQKYIGLLCCDLSSKRYNILKMIKKWYFFGEACTNQLEISAHFKSRLHGTAEITINPRLSYHEPKKKFEILKQ